MKSIKFNNEDGETIELRRGMDGEIRIRHSRHILKISFPDGEAGLIPLVSMRSRIVCLVIGFCFDFMAVFFWLVWMRRKVKCAGTMKPDEPQPEERLRRMREMFDRERSILAEDYEYFSGMKIRPHEPTRLSKAGHTSAVSNAPQSQEPN